MSATTTSERRLETVRQLVRQLYGLGLIQREINRHALAELGSQGFAALASIGLHGPLRVSDVAARLHVDLSVASRQIAALDRAGYVARVQDGDDRRALLVSLTDAGRDVLADTHRRMVDAFGHALGEWTDADIAALTKGLARLREDFEPDPHTALPDPSSSPTS
ncbi:MAG: MarR family winged helix-turn-helix transcriptional regulator [Solirubrobacteraceae bacterium]